MQGDCVEYSESYKREIAHHLNLLSDSSTSVSLYKVTADYRKNNPNKPNYYVLGRSIKEAKQRFKNRISWLEIYGYKVCDDETAKDIVSNPIHHIVF